MQGSPAADPLTEDIAAIEALAEAPVATAEDLAATLGRVYTQIFNADLARYDAQVARRSAAALLARIFALRMKLRDQIPAWGTRGLMTIEVQKALRDVFRVARYAVDMLGEIAIGHDRIGEDGETHRAFTGGDHNTQFHPSFTASRPPVFKSGDVVIVRGMLHNSAAIARVGDVDSQFSHAAMLYIDGAQRQWAVESLIEDGALVTPFDEMLDHRLGRAALFRHKDANLAARAAELIHDRVVRSRESGGRRILYDFTMQLGGYGELFCSKLVREAFDQASEGRVKPPTYPTRFDMRNRDFLDRIGVTAAETFAPGDMDIDPDFDLVAEWQDYRVTSNLRLQDMVMTKMFEWMEEDGYTFREDFAIWLIGLLGRASSHLSEKAKKLIEDIVPRVPVNMSRSTVAAIAMLHKTAEPLYRAMQQLEADCIRETGRTLHPRDVLAALERIRETSHRRRVGYLAPSR